MIVTGEPWTTVPARPVQAALYARVSTRDKDQDPEVQLVPMRQHADARGWKATGYVDRASAAHMGGRTAWARLVEDARRRQVDLVMVWKLDRAFRSTLHCLRTLESWEHQGVGFPAFPARFFTPKRRSQGGRGRRAPDQ
jgi:DNA invertase Pin-like site-specific DNA recombinase